MATQKGLQNMILTVKNKMIYLCATLPSVEMDIRQLTYANTGL